DLYDIYAGVSLEHFVDADARDSKNLLARSLEEAAMIPAVVVRYRERDRAAETAGCRPDRLDVADPRFPDIRAEQRVVCGLRRDGDSRAFRPNDPRSENAEVADVRADVEQGHPGLEAGAEKTGLNWL